MDADATTAGRPQPPAPARRVIIARAPAPERIARLLVLIRWIIGYGTNLAATIHQRATRPGFEDIAGRYRKGDLAIIVERIKRGLLLAAGLEAKLIECAGRGGNVPLGRLRGMSLRRQGAGAPKQPGRPRRTPFIDLPLDRLPTAEDIAGELRRRPVGAVLVDICRDLGLRQCDLPQELWRDFYDTVVHFGGRLNDLICGEFNASELHQAVLRQFRGKRAPWAAPRTAAATGPP